MLSTVDLYVDKLPKQFMWYLLSTADSMLINYPHNMCTALVSTILSLLVNFPHNTCRYYLLSIADLHADKLHIMHEVLAIYRLPTNLCVDRAGHNKHILIIITVIFELINYLPICTSWYLSYLLLILALINYPHNSCITCYYTS